MGRRGGLRAGVLGRWLAVALGVAVLGLVAASYLLDLGRRPSAEPPAPDPETAPADVAPPPGLVLPRLAAPSPVAAALPAQGAGRADGGSGAAPLSATKIRLALAAGLLDRRLGRHVVAAVAPVATGRPVFTVGRGRIIPASTTKLLTAAAALATLGPDHTFATSVVAGPGRGSVVLVGGGDPFLAGRPATAAERRTTYPPRADVVTLARRTAAALRRDGVRRVRVGYDDSLFSGPVGSPGWEPHYLPEGVVAPITALWVDEGRPAAGYGRVADPSATAAAAFAAALSRNGVRVLGGPREQRAPARAPRLAAVRSAPLAAIVERVLDVSDNEASEVLAHHVGLATGAGGSFAGGTRGVTRTLRGLGIDTRGAVLYDGSGLSRRNRLSTATLLGVLRVAASSDHPYLRPVLTGLPVAGFTGSLAYRFDKGPPAGLGRVRAKTGTLTGVHGLAGVATDLDGNAMSFVLVADRVKVRHTLTARAVLDGLAGALGACRCGR